MYVYIYMCVYIYIYVYAAEKQLHSMRLLPAHFTFGMVSAADEQSWFPSNMMLRIEVHQTRESCFSQSEGPLGASLQISSVFSCVFTDFLSISPSVDFSYLHIWSWSSTRVTIRFLVTTLTKALLHQLLSLARRPALGRVLVVSNFFH